MVEFGFVWMSLVWCGLVRFDKDEFGLVELSSLDNRESSGSTIQFSLRTCSFSDYKGL